MNDVSWGLNVSRHQNEYLIRMWWIKWYVIGFGFEGRENKNNLIFQFIALTAVSFLFLMLISIDFWAWEGVDSNSTERLSISCLVSMLWQDCDRTRTSYCWLCNLNNFIIYDFVLEQTNNKYSPSIWFYIWSFLICLSPLWKRCKRFA